MANRIIELRLTAEDARELVSELDRDDNGMGGSYSAFGEKIARRIKRLLDDEDAWACPTCGGYAWREGYGDS